MHNRPPLPTPTLSATALVACAFAAVFGLVATASCSDDTATAVHDVVANDSDDTPVDVAGELTATVACTACAGKCTEESWKYSNVFHDDGVINYTESPPSAGTHASCWWTWGTFATQVPTARFVHNLEHGGLVMVYDCPGGCAADIAALTKTGEASGLKFIVTPFAGAAARIVAVAWEHRLLLDCVDEAAIVAFAKKWAPGAPEQVDVGPSASCM